MRTVLASAAVTLAAAASAPLLAAGYERPAPVTAVLAGTAVLAVAVTTVLHRLLRGLGPLAVPAGLPAAAIGLVAVAAWSPGPVKEPVPAALDAALHSGARILTTAPYPPATVDLLAFPLLAVWLAGAIATVLRRDGRVLSALLPGAVLLCGAAALNPEAVEAGYGSAALLALALTVTLASASPDVPDTTRAGFTVEVRPPVPAARAAGRGSLPRLAAAGAAAVCAVSLPGVGAAVAAPGVLDAWPVRADDPRRQGEVSEKPRQVRNPLAYLSAWAAQPDVPLMKVSGPRTDLRWVALSEFTGPVWLPDSTYRPAGPVLPPAETEPPRAERATVRVTVQNLPGDWVPVPGIATRVDGIAVGHDALSGTLLSLDGPMTGRSYTATGTVPDWSGWQGADAAAASGTGFERYLYLPPGTPPRLSEIARVAAGDGSAHRRASRIAEYLRDSYTFDPNARGGHGYAELSELLVPPGRKGRGATSEQFASAFAVLARAAGLPSRVVVGFAPGEGGGDGTIRTGDGVAWGEVYYEGLGWVPYDPNPRKRSESSPEPRPGERENRDGAHRDDGADDTAAGDGPRAGSAAGGGRAPLYAVPLALLVLFLTAVPGLRVWRSRRLRGTGPGGVLAAWAELQVAMRLAGRGAPSSATAAEVSAGLAALPGTDPERLSRLGAVVNAAGFGGTVTPEDAAFASGEIRSLAAALRRSRPLPLRLAWWWDPRALVWSARASRPSRPERRKGEEQESRPAGVSARTGER